PYTAAPIFRTIFPSAVKHLTLTIVTGLSWIPYPLPDPLPCVRSPPRKIRGPPWPGWEPARTYPYVVPGRARTNPCLPYSPPELRNRSRSRSPLRRGAPVGQTRSAYAPSPCGSLAYAAQTGSALSPRRDGSLPTLVLPFARLLSAPKAESGATGWPGLPSLPNCSPPRALPIPIAATPAPPPAPRLESGPAACDSSPACALDSSGSGTSPRG